MDPDNLAEQPIHLLCFVVIFSSELHELRVKADIFYLF